MPRICQWYWFHCIPCSEWRTSKTVCKREYACRATRDQATLPKGILRPFPNDPMWPVTRQVRQQPRGVSFPAVSSKPATSVIVLHSLVPWPVALRAKQKGRELNAPPQEAPRSAYPENTPSRALVGRGSGRSLDSENSRFSCETRSRSYANRFWLLVTGDSSLLLLHRSVAVLARGGQALKQNSR
jgi:hypothetical protein